MLHRAPCAFKIVDKLVRNRCGNFVANVKREEVIALANAKKSRCGPRLDQYIREGIHPIEKLLYFIQFLIIS